MEHQRPGVPRVVPNPHSGSSGRPHKVPALLRASHHHGKAPSLLHDNNHVKAMQEDLIGNYGTIELPLLKKDIPNVPVLPTTPHPSAGDGGPAGTGTYPEWCGPTDNFFCWRIDPQRKQLCDCIPGPSICTMCAVRVLLWSCCACAAFAACAGCGASEQPLRPSQTFAPKPPRRSKTQSLCTWDSTLGPFLFQTISLVS